MDSNKILAVMGNDKWLSAGESIFKGTCAVCHGQQGEGIEALGLNLTDETYLYVQKITDISDIVKNGTPSKKMPPQVQFNENEIAMVAGYVATLRGKNIEGPASQVQGVEIPPFPQPQSQDESQPSDG
jgi:cytochrome c oxidase cbb3-type subunit 3